MSIRSSIVFLLVSALLLGLAWAHRPIETNLFLTTRLKDTHFELEIDAASFLLEPFHAMEFKDDLPEDLEAEKQKLVDWLAENCPVVVDGETLTPVVEKFEFSKLFGATHLADFKNIIMVWAVVHYPLEAKPKIIDTIWDAYVPEPPYGWGGIADPDQEPDAVNVQFKVYNKFRYYNLSPREPQYIWRAQPEVPPQLELAVAEAPPPVRVPVASLVLLGVGLFGALFALRGSRKGALGIGLAGLAAAAMALPTTVDFGGGVPAVPSPEKAEAGFDALLRNMYAAFDYAEEEDIYDALAGSIDGPLLGKLYNEIHRSLVLEDDGGVKCQIKNLEITDTTFGETLPLDDGTEAYTVDSTWAALGSVSHWGHTHERLNKYTATFQLEPRGAQWKICAINITEQKRIDPAEKAKAEADAAAEAEAVGKDADERDAEAGVSEEDFEREFDPTKPSL